MLSFLIVGLGSMGKRRIRNLKHLGFDNLTGYDTRPDRREEAVTKYGINTVSDWKEAKSLEVNAWVISTPPDTHLAYGLQAIERGIAFFTEAGVVDDKITEIIQRLDKTGIIGAPSCTQRYFAGPKKIKEIVKSGKIGHPLNFTYHSGQYLPDWHPWENYQDFYVSKRETGACREIVPFELCWLVDLFGTVVRLTCINDKVSDLDADIDDVYHLLMKFDTGILGHLLVDVIARPATRLFRLCGSEGTIEWDQSQNIVRSWTIESGDWETIDISQATIEEGYINPEEPYIEEMADFIAAVKGEKPWRYSYEADEATLKLLVRAELSNDSGTHC